MEVKLFILLTFTRCKWTYPAHVSVSGEISEDITFLHKTFPVLPSMRVIIEVNVSYPDISRLQKGHYLRVWIYTTKDHVNIIKQCVDKDTGQLGNEYLHPPIAEHLRPLRCFAHGNILYCRRNITVRDFIPRKSSFSFGFDCDNADARDSLKGLFYNMSIYGTNKIECFKLPHNQTCYRYLQHRAQLNLRGMEYQRDDHLFLFDRLKFVDFFKCYQHLHEFLCYEVVPKCDPVLKQVIHPCREMCQDAKNACDPNGFFDFINCNYLPSLGGDIPCFYEPVFCRAPAIVENATVKTNSSRSFEHFMYDTAEYSCGERFEMVGNKNITCTYRGQWSLHLGAY